MLPQPCSNKLLFRTMRDDARGVTILELVIIIAILSVALVGVLGLATFSLITSAVAKQTAESTIFAQGAMETLRNYRDGVPWNDDDIGDEYDGLGVVDLDTAYHFEQSSGTPPRWKLLTGTDTIGIFTRSVIFKNVCRNSGTDDITGITDTNGATTTCGGSGGAHDTETMEATVNVSWTHRARSYDVQIVMYLTNWR